MKIQETIKTFFKCIFRANKDEKEEIQNLQITSVDKNEAAILTNLIAAVLSSYGVPSTREQNKAMEKALAYGIRDLKEGIKEPHRLLVVRIVDELKENL